MTALADTDPGTMHSTSTAGIVKKPSLIADLETRSRGGGETLQKVLQKPRVCNNPRNPFSERILE
jgi:hypothetical protein